MAKYSYEFKKMIVDAYLNGEGGYKHLSSVYGPTRRDIQKWGNRFRAAGPDALRPHKKGRNKILDKSCKNPKIVPSEESSVDAHLHLFLLPESVLLRHPNPRHREIHCFLEFDEIQQKHHHCQYGHSSFSIYTDDFYTPFVTISIAKFHLGIYFFHPNDHF